MSEPQENQNEELREFESAANKEAIERENAMDDARRTCLELRIEIDQLTKQRDVEISRAARIARERDKAEAELAKRFPDIGPDPLKLDGDEWKKRGDISKVREALNEARSAQQAGVPDQTALVWRIDISRLMDDHTVLAARWRDLKPALEKAEAEAAELRDALRRLIPFAQSYRSHPLRNPEDKLDSALEKCQHALSSDCGKDYIHREISVNKLVDAFVACPLPDSVCSDHCACIRGYKHRSGTNLLSVEEARQMFTQILKSLRKEL